MTELAMNYFVNPFTRLYEAIKYGIELSSYARAAEELRRLGHYEAADQIYKRMREMR